MDPDDLRKRFGQSGHAKRPFDRGLFDPNCGSSLIPLL
jgi:hypothetical protein